MSTDLSELTADELQARTREWLADHLPAGWMDAVDAGDAATVAAMRGELDYAKWCTEFGESGFATPTWPADYGAGLSLTPGQARPVNEVRSACTSKVTRAAAEGSRSTFTKPASQRVGRVTCATGSDR